MKRSKLKKKKKKTNAVTESYNAVQDNEIDS